MALFAILRLSGHYPAGAAAMVSNLAGMAELDTGSEVLVRNFL